MGVHDMSGQRVAIKVIDKLKLKVGLNKMGLKLTSAYEAWRLA